MGSNLVLAARLGRARGRNGGRLRRRPARARRRARGRAAAGAGSRDAVAACRCERRAREGHVDMRGKQVGQWKGEASATLRSRRRGLGGLARRAHRGPLHRGRAGSRVDGGVDRPGGAHGRPPRGRGHARGHGARPHVERARRGHGARHSRAGARRGGGGRDDRHRAQGPRGAHRALHAVDAVAAHRTRPRARLPRRSGPRPARSPRRARSTSARARARSA